MFSDNPANAASNNKFSKSVCVAILIHSYFSIRPQATTDRPAMVLVVQIPEVDTTQQPKDLWGIFLVYMLDTLYPQARPQILTDFLIPLLVYPIHPLQANLQQPQVDL